MSENAKEPPLSIATERNVYVVVPPSPFFAAHRSLFLPGEHKDGRLPSDPENHRGRRIHVSGDRLSGFELEIIREYDVSKHRSGAGRKYLIGTFTSVYSETSQEVENATLTGFDRKDEDEGGGYINNRPQDQFEAACVLVKAPGPSLRSVKETQDGMRTRLVEQKNCQSWIRDVVETLINCGILRSLPDSRESPIELLEKVPKH